MTETLNTTGFLITEIAGEWSLVSADFGGGYRAAALIGSAEGTRTFTIQIDVLPDDPTLRPLPTIDGISREQYLWAFFRKSKDDDDAPFWIELEDPETHGRKNYLASFVDHALTYQVLCAKIYKTGLNLRQRRLRDTPSPIPA
jgi:hypothetical protein